MVELPADDSLLAFAPQAATAPHDRELREPEHFQPLPPQADTSPPVEPIVDEVIRTETGTAERAPTPQSITSAPVPLSASNRVGEDESAAGVGESGEIAPAGAEAPVPDPPDSGRVVWPEWALPTPTIDGPEPAPAESATTWTWTRAAIAVLLLMLLLQIAWSLRWWRSDTTSQAAAVSSITITSEPEGSVVSIDGVTRGLTPLTTTLPAGTHQLQVGDAAPRAVTLEGGANSSMHVVLATTAPAAVATGSVEITTEPAGAAISVDGIPRGVSPVRVGDLPPGVHEVTLSRAGRQLRRSVTVQAGSAASLVVALESGGTASGWLTVTSPVPAQIFADGTLIGHTDTPRTLVPAGRHRLLLLNKPLNYREERTVNVGPGRTVSIELQPVSGTININAQPWASVWVDGTALGETPIGNHPLPIGTHEVVLRHPQLGERRQMVAVGVGAPARLGVDLRK